LSALNDSIETIIKREGRHRGRSCETKISIPGSIANLPQTLLGFPIRNKILQQGKKGRTQSAKFTTVRRGEFIEDLGAGTAELDEDLTAVIQGGMSLDQILSRKAINQFDGGMVYDLKLLRQLTDGQTLSLSGSFDCEQGLVLPRGQTGSLSGFFTKLEESPKMIAESSEHSVLAFSKGARRGRH
jgi:hypothetical protein